MEKRNFVLILIVFAFFASALFSLGYFVFKSDVVYRKTNFGSGTATPTGNDSANKTGEYDLITWEDAVRKIENCEIKLISQSHDLNVGLVGVDDKAYKTVEPTIDEVFKVENKVRSKCPPMMSVTE